MVQSLVDDARQTGWLPKWAIVAGDTSQVNGDSADPIIADAYAMGVRNFDVAAALRAMVKGATQNETGHGLEIERQYLSQYLSQHYVNAASLDLTSIDYSIGGSVTLEYAIDDFAIARLAAALGDHALASTMMGRAANWEYLFNPATGFIGARGSDGSFPPGPAFQTSQFEPGGQLGFEEGNAVQYTWYVPQDLAALASLMGGDAAAASKLTTFFTSLNATRYAPYDWSGNEPGEWAPWMFDYFGAPERTQGTVRAIVNTEYADAPVDEPGNDDLGAISSWYVWAALGLFPVTPGTANLALASPLFPSVTIALPDGRRLVERATGAAASRPYVHALTVTTVPRPAPAPTAAGCPASAASGSHAASGTWDRPWLPSSVLRSGATLSYTLSSRPDPAWASAPAASPPSFTQGELPAVGFSLPSGSISLATGQATTVQIGVASAGGSPTSVRWQVTSERGGLEVAPTSGTLTLGPPSSRQDSGGACGPPPPATEAFTVTRGHPRVMRAARGPDHDRRRRAPSGRARRRDPPLSRRRVHPSRPTPPRRDHHELRGTAARDAPAPQRGPHGRPARESPASRAPWTHRRSGAPAGSTGSWPVWSTGWRSHFPPPGDSRWPPLRPVRRRPARSASRGRCARLPDRRRSRPS